MRNQIRSPTLRKTDAKVAAGHHTITHKHAHSLYTARSNLEIDPPFPRNRKLRREGEVRGAKPLMAVVFYLSSLLLMLLFSSLRAVEGAGLSGGGGRRSGPVEWDMVTKTNFTSQIRLHPHVLLMITVPWSGEPRSLMKEISFLVADKQEELGNLKLLVMSRHSEKMLADALGAAEGTKLIYYHHSISYKYQGRLSAQSILSSVYHFMSLQSEQIPLKTLYTQQELENFYESTDKAVILLEFCGWSGELLHRRNHEDDDSASIHNHTENVELLEENLAREAGVKPAFEKVQNQKIHGLESEELSCGTQSGMGNSPLLEGFTQANQSDLRGNDYRGDSAEMSCTSENFYKFKSFFLRFLKISREHFLPPERQRFGLISDRSLLPSLNVGNPGTWSVVVQFSGCPNCSMVLHEGHNLSTILSTNHPLVKEVDLDGSTQSLFPEKRPSVILFIDRSSDSSKIRGESKSALQVLRRFATENQLFHQIIGGHDSNPGSSSAKHFSRTWSQGISDLVFPQGIKDSGAAKIVKFKDNMAIMITNNDQSISLDAAAETQVNSLHDILAHLLRKRPKSGTKETKISLLARDVGFQLLSDDFEVQVTDSSLSHHEDSQVNNVKDNAMTILEDKTSQLPEESNKDFTTCNESTLDVSNVVSSDDGKQPELVITETSQQNHDTVNYSQSNINKLSSKFVEEVEDDVPSSRSKKVTDDDKPCNQENLHSFTCHAKDTFYLEKELPAVDKSGEAQHIDHNECISTEKCSNGSEQKMSDVIPSEVLGENNAAEVLQSIETIDKWHAQKLLSKGSFFFSDGGYQLLRSLTGGAKIPSLVILDPVLQQHYVFPEKSDISSSSLVSFVESFLNGSLTPYRRTSSSVMNSREFPRPPFVNLAFHEADSLPQVTLNTFCELILGYRPCEIRNPLSFSQIQSFGSVWKVDVLVLFSMSSCGFCQRMELIVREVYRAFKYFTTMVKSEYQSWDSIHSKGRTEATIGSGLPHILLMDCTLNDCGSLLQSIGKKEIYPTLLLFPAENKSSIAYEGDMSVVNIIKFLLSYGSNTQHLAKQKGILWTQPWKGSKNPATSHNEPSAAHDGAHLSEDNHNKILIDTEARRGQQFPIGLHTQIKLKSEDHPVVPGSVLTATDELLNNVVFNNSTIIIVKADKNQGFEGVIINKRISWGVFKEFNEQLEFLKQAPLSYGGPVTAQGYPLVSLTRKYDEGCVKVTDGVYYGDPLSTRLAIERVRLGDQSVYDYWFFLGYSAWSWDQLFDELAAGSWRLSEPPRDLDWPDR